MTISVVLMPKREATQRVPQFMQQTLTKAAQQENRVVAARLRAPQHRDRTNTTSRMKVKCRRTGTPKTRKALIVPDVAA